MKKNGFTLIELLVAMTIMALLMSLALVAYQGAKKSARDGRRKADLEQIRSALEIYRTDCKTYPSSLSWGGQLKGDDSSSACSSSNVYLDQIPSDPGSCSYYYSRSSSNSYTLCASLETGGNLVSGCGSCGSGCTCNYKVTNP